jgi:hypothetical protein
MYFIGARRIECQQFAGELLWKRAVRMSEYGNGQAALGAAELNQRAIHTVE